MSSTAGLGATSFYVYYRVRPDCVELARGLVDRLMETVSRRFGVQGRLLVRREDPLLWMEVYQALPDAGEFEAALEGECERLDFAAALLPGSSRQCECFVELARCA